MAKIPGKTKPAPKTSALILDPKNAKKHSDRNKQLIRQSLESVGPFRSIGAVHGVVRVGNGVFEQAQDLGLKIKRIKADRDTLIVVDRDDLSEEEADRAALLDNVTADSSAYQYDAERFAELVRGDKLLAELADAEQQYRKLLSQDPTKVVFDEYDEDVEKDVKFAVCPECGHRFAI